MIKNVPIRIKYFQIVQLEQRFMMVAWVARLSKMCAIYLVLIPAEGNITYASSSDGTVTFICTEPLATVWMNNGEEFMTQFTQGILDHAETVTLPDGDPDMIRQDSCSTEVREIMVE